MHMLLIDYTTIPFKYKGGPFIAETRNLLEGIFKGARKGTTP